jgi:hypothetical protein
VSDTYLQGQALLTACAAGTGVIVIVEGETYRDDVYFFSRWFGDRAREVSFFPQNGWARVVAAVTELRAALPGRRVFGIVDRDFAAADVLAAQAAARPADGVFRLSLYTLENYLLDPAGWLLVARGLHRDVPPAGWTTVAEVGGQIERAYRACQRVGAFNRTVHDEAARTDGLRYREFPAAVENAEMDLVAWGAKRGSARPLDEVFRRHLESLASLDVADLARSITGKAVVKVLSQTLLTWKRKGLPAEHLLDLYLDKLPTPPAEIASLVTRIVERDGLP